MCLIYFTLLFACLFVRDNHYWKVRTCSFFLFHFLVFIFFLGFLRNRVLFEASLIPHLGLLFFFPLFRSKHLLCLSGR